MSSPGVLDLARLAQLAESGDLHTVRISWSDRLGSWRGKRVPVELFLAAPDRRVGFCDGMLVVDVQADVDERTPFSNFQTGYPDVYVRPDLASLRAAPWTGGEAFVLGDPTDHHGHPVDVSPRVVLARVLDRLATLQVDASVRVTLTGRLMRDPASPVVLGPGGAGEGEPRPGALRAAAEGLIGAGIPVERIETGADPGLFRLGLAPLPPLAAADAAVVAKNALKEIALGRGLTATFMTLVPNASEPAELRLDLDLAGPVTPPTGEQLAARLARVAGLLWPSVTALRATPPAPPLVERGQVRDVRAASEADPVTAIALALAAAASDQTCEPTDPPADLGAASRLLDGCGWARDWLGHGLIDNAVPLLVREDELFRQAVTDWEVQRYWRLG